MEGVILFVDDEVFNASFENKLFKELSSDKKNPILPINNLDDFEKTIKSISTYNAIILDWEFLEDLEGVPVKQLPINILLENNLYCLIFIYSHTVISSENKDLLKGKYGDKIEFLTKISNEAEIVKEKEKVLNAIIEFKGKNPHLVVPYIWSQAMNESSQLIFSELEAADKYWIKELFYSSVRSFDKKTGIPKEVEVEPTIEVINLFQSLLSERLIQHDFLKDSIKQNAISYFKDMPAFSSIKNLYTRLYYTNALETDTVMTGDVFEIAENTFGVIISPECDIIKLVKKNMPIELLCFNVDDFKMIDDFCKTSDEIQRAYNQELSAIHLLPVFPFSETLRSTALIDFRFSLKLINGKFLDSNKPLRKIRVNPPYIQQIRQRYLAYIGRVGVPTIPQSLRAYSTK